MKNLKEPKLASDRGNAIERRRFGSTEREVAVIGQGTWYIENSQGGHLPRSQPYAGDSTLA